LRGLVSGCVGLVFNLLSAVLVLGSLVTAAGVAALYQAPSLAGLLPPTGAWLIPTQPVLVAALPTITPEPSATPRGTPDEAFPTLPPEWTPTDTPTVTATLPPQTPSATPRNAATPTGRAANATPGTGTPPATAGTEVGLLALPTHTRSAFSFNLLNDTATYLPNSINGSGCSWFGFAGQAFGLDGRPIIGLTVHLEGDGVSLDALTGSQPAIGPGGYEIPLGNHPVETSDVYRIQLRNNSGSPLSDDIVVPTFGDCRRNLVLVNFVQNH
jgi:hypothetical protein